MNLEAIAGVAHEPDGTPTGVVLLTHGAGSNREAPLIVRTCDEWARHGWLAGGAVVCVERASRDPEFAWPDGFDPLRARKYGEGTLWYGHRREQ